MMSGLSSELLMRLLRATPEQYAAVERVLGMEASTVEIGNAEKKSAGEVVAFGRLKCLPGFNDVWVDDTAYDLRERSQVRLCLQFLVENGAQSPGSARHFVDEIDPYVRAHGNFPRSAEPKIDHYFNDHSGKLPALRKALVQVVHGKGRYFLKVD